MITNDITIRIGGVAGAGISATINVLARIFKEHGYHIQTFRDIPSRIRGGHTNETIRATTKGYFSVPDYIDYLVALDLETIRKFLRELREGGVLIVDVSSVRNFKKFVDEREDIIIYEVPAKELALKNLGNEIYKNSIILGVLIHLLDMDKKIVEDVIRRAYERKGAKIIDLNLKALTIGESFARENIEKKDDYKIVKRKVKEKFLLLTGNEAIALGAIVAGCRFMAGYPITPATQILEFMAKYLPKYGGAVVQTEDEIAAINYVIGAAIAGARAMTATSGPGLSLMTEGISLAGMAEVPIVVVNSNRAGPSTGMPTKTEQSDLLFVIFQGHGDFPKVVLAPSTNEEAFYMTAEAFNVADKCQCPVIVLVDEFLSHGFQTAKKFDINKIRIDRGTFYINGADEFVDKGLFLRYKITENGLSPRTIPGGSPKPFIVASLEHDEHGWPTEDPDVRKAMMDKRFKKMESLAPELFKLFKPEIIGFDDAKYGIISFGSTRGAIIEAMDRLKKRDIGLKFLRLKMLWPMDGDAIKRFVNSLEKVFVIEMNATGQLLKLIRMVVGESNKFVSILKYDGRMFKPSEIYESILEVIGGGE